MRKKRWRGGERERAASEVEIWDEMDPQEEERRDGERRGRDK